MRAFILAAGEGTRMWPLTDTRPKPLIPVLNKPIIEYVMDAVVDAGIDKIGILIGHEGRRIVEKYGNRYRGARIDYVYQEERLGTGHAVLHAERFPEDRFLVVNGDLLFDPDVVKEAVKYENAIVGVYRENAERFGLLVGEENLVEVREKVPNSSGWVNAGIYSFTREIFEHIRSVGLSPRGEIELTDAVNRMARVRDIKIVRYEGLWMDLGMPWDIFNATRILLDRMDCGIDGDVEDGVHIRGKVCIGEGTRVLSGTYIEGPVYIGRNCKIGPNAYIRPYTVIGDDCHVGNACEVKASVVMNNSKIPHFNYVGDSIIGENCNLGAGTKIANLRLDERNIKVPVKGKMVDTGRRKLGAIMGDDVHTGINVSIDVGTMIGAHTAIAPGARVKGVVGTGSRVF